MELRKDILWRVYLCFLGIVVLCLLVLGKAVYIQQAEGGYWRARADSIHQRIVDLGAERGTIYSEDGNMLSTSIPFFTIYIDFAADGLREKNGRRFKENVDSLSYCLASLFRDRTVAGYKKELLQGFKNEDRYYLLQKNISFEQYKQLRQFPLVRQGRNKSGFITETSSHRINPYGLLANRTIGLSRDNAQNVGLERTYDTLLKGENGRRLVRYISSNSYIPVEGSEIDPENGKDIQTTIDVNMQDIAENALLAEMQSNEAVHGTCIVMEVATGKIRAMANLGLQADGKYWEDLNYAIRASEPGSTFKLATMLALLEDHNVKLTDMVDLESGTWKIGTRTVHDSEKHREGSFTVQQAFEVSSNVGMAKLAVAGYRDHPSRFIDHLKRLRLDQVTGIDLAGETHPIIKTPKSRTWSNSTLPWMAFGYEVLVSPLQTLTLYNAVANQGRMMKPYLVNAVQYAGGVEKQTRPVVQIEKICSDNTLAQLKTCLEGVCLQGTAKTAMKNTFYPVAGKTGTALIADGAKGYAERIYQSSFAGYFPADHPKYSCIVVIRNKSKAKNYLGALVAGPVFREVADKLMSLEKPDRLYANRGADQWTRDSSAYFFAGNSSEMKSVLTGMQMSYLDSASGRWARMYPVNASPVLQERADDMKKVPDVKGMGLKDALYALESRHFQVQTRGSGKVKAQSIAPGSAVSVNDRTNGNSKNLISIELN